MADMQRFSAVLVALAAILVFPGCDTTGDANQPAVGSISVQPKADSDAMYPKAKANAAPGKRP